MDLLLKLERTNFNDAEEILGDGLRTLTQYARVMNHQVPIADVDVNEYIHLCLLEMMDTLTWPMWDRKSEVTRVRKVLTYLRLLPTEAPNLLVGLLTHRTITYVQNWFNQNFTRDEMNELREYALNQTDEQPS